MRGGQQDSRVDRLGEVVAKAVSATGCVMSWPVITTTGMSLRASSTTRTKDVRTLLRRQGGHCLGDEPVVFDDQDAPVLKRRDR
jgi:hypothetical protein